MGNIEIKEHTINKLIELIRTNYPNFFRIYTEQEIKDILNKNISEITTGWYSKSKSGQYNFITKKICLSNKKEDSSQIELQDIIKNPDYEFTLEHEALHALFGRVEQNEEFFVYKESTFIYCEDGEDEIGRGLSEGLKEWLLSKLYAIKPYNVQCNILEVNTTSESYPLETNVVIQLEAILGDETILQICKHGIDSFRTVCQNALKSIEFLAKIDEILYHNKNTRELEAVLDELEDVWIDRNEEMEQKQIHEKYPILEERNIDLANLDEEINCIEEIVQDEYFNLNQRILQVQRIIDDIIVHKYKTGDVLQATKMYKAVKKFRMTESIDEENKEIFDKLEASLEEEPKTIDIKNEEEK